MIKWTTPTMECSIPSDIVCDYVILSLRQGDVLIEKTVQSSDIVDGAFSVTLTQSETGQLVPSNLYTQVEAQLNIIKDSTRIATNIVILEVSDNLHDQSI